MTGSRVTRGGSGEGPAAPVATACRPPNPPAPFLLRRAALLLGLALGLGGCENRQFHIFGGYAFEPDGGPEGGCLATSGAVDVLDGPDPATPCTKLRCWMAPDGTAYVTDRACDGPPDFRDGTADTSGACAAALAAYGADGGQVRCPVVPEDAGT